MSLQAVAAEIVGSGGGRGGGPGRGGPPGRGGASSGLQQLDPRQMRKLNSLLRNAKFNVTHRLVRPLWYSSFILIATRKTSRVFTMRGLTTQPAADLKFLLSGRDGKPDRMVSVVEYYKTQYNVTVTKPRLPCVSYGQKNYVPMEFVNLAEFNSIPMLQLTGDQQGQPAVSVACSLMLMSPRRGDDQSRCQESNRPCR